MLLFTMFKNGLGDGLSEGKPLTKIIFNSIKSQSFDHAVKKRDFFPVNPNGSLDQRRGGKIRSNRKIT